jgi:hypothetical protein
MPRGLLASNEIIGRDVNETRYLGGESMDK